MTTNPHPGPSPDESTAPPAPKAPTPRWLVVMVSFVVGVVVGTVGMALFGSTGNDTPGEQRTGEASATPADTRLPDAVRACDLANAMDRPYATISDGSQTLTFDHRGEDDDGGIEAADVFCILDQLNAPSFVISHMDQTTSMDGRQTESWEGLTVSWSYHPDRGLDGIITVD